MSSCLSGGSRAYKLNLDLIKPPTSSWTSNFSSSSSSILSEPNKSISTRKNRTPRKRPNQTYNEAASILSTAYPKLFPTKHITNPCKFTKSLDKKSPFSFEPSGLLIPSTFMDDDSGHLLPILERPSFCIGSKNLNLFEKPCQSRGEMMNSSGKAWDEYGEDIDGGLVLDEEIEEGIDSIMGNGKTDDSDIMQLSNTCCYGYQTVGLGFDVGYGMRKELKAMRNVGEGDDWWRFPAVDLADLTQKIAEIPVEKKKKKKNLESGKQNSFLASNPNKEHLGSAASCEEAFRRTCGGLLLKLNYDDVLSAWSDRGSPFSGEGPSGDDVQARLAQVDLFPEKEAGRDSNVPRYKEKRRRKMRCQVRKVKADQRLRFYEARDTLD